MLFLRNQHLVFMPGLDGTGKSFDPLVSFLAADARITIVRYPTDKFLSFEETVECAAAQIPDGHPPVVIAESFSGPVAVQMITSGRIKAQALVLCATFARSPHPVSWRVVRFLKLPLLIRPDMPRAFFKFIIGDEQQITALLPLWKKVHADVPAHMMASRLALINNLDVTQELRKLTIPCCYLQATDDRIVPSRCLKDFDRNIPHLYVRKIKAPHFILQAAPQTCLATIDKFLQLNTGDASGDHIAALKQQIADLKQQSADLRQSEAFFRSINQESSDITIIVNTKAVITYVNPSIEKFLGYKPEELIGKSGFDYIIPNDLPRAILDFGKSLLTREIKIPNSFHIRHKDGSIHVLEGVGVNLLYNAVVKGFVMNVRDITDRRKAEADLETYRKHLEDLVEKRTANLTLFNANLIDELAKREKAEKALKESEEKYRDFIENAPIGVGIIDLTGKIQYINKGIENLMGWSREEIIGKDGFGLESFDDEARKRLMERFAARIKGDPPQIFESAVTAKDGSRLWVEVITTIARRDGMPVGAQMVFVNLTERKRAEAEREALMDRLHRAEKMESLSNMAGGIAHDLNNVLGVLVGNTELLMMKMREEDPLKKLLHNIMKASEKATAILQDMLTLARRGVAVSEVVNLNNVLVDFFQTPEFERLKSYHPLVNFTKELTGDLLNIRGAPVHLGKTVLNLVYNAVEAVADKGEVTVSTRNGYLDKPLPGYGEVHEGDYVVLTVCDNGQGIPSADINKIFEPFYTKKAMGRSGAGLGLGVVWGTVKDHQGYIDVQSEPGKGSAFTIYFPATREALKARQPALPLESYMGKGESVLVADDMQEQREVAASLLTRLGYSVKTVSSGKEAVEYLKSQTAAILVLDMLMEPGIDGLETYKRILEINPNQKAIMVSGLPETDRVKQALDLGASSYIRKPYLLESMGTAIRRALQATPLQAESDAPKRDRRKYDRRRPALKSS
jgi:PAS domain S-box-containing protein